MCTSKKLETDRVWGLRQGAKDYITKPVDPAELMEKIKALGWFEKLMTKNRTSQHSIFLAKIQINSLTWPIIWSALGDLMLIFDKLFWDNNYTSAEPHPILKRSATPDLNVALVSTLISCI